MTSQRTPTVDELQAELDALRATRTFRWTARLRDLYRRLRRRRAASPDAASDSLYAQPRHVERVEDCHVYHTMEVPGYGLLPGEWDLRARVDEYLGGCSFAGRRVLEIGPASGFLTFHMEQAGAEVVSVELAPEARIDAVPAWYVDWPAFLASSPLAWERLTNAYWLAHRAFGSRARVHQGSVYDLPSALGTFDVAVLGAVLVHLRDPAGALAQCAQRSTDTIVVTDLHHPEVPRRPVLELYPSSQNRVANAWWRLTPELVVSLLDVYGFRNAQVTFHEQHYVTIDEMWPMFTVVASR